MARHHAGRRPIRRLVRMLRGIQRNERLTIEDMALRLGVSTSMLAMVYSGRRSPGRKFLRGVLKAYPQLRDEVHAFLLRDARPAGRATGGVSDHER
jgi:transcriptional regulator with XRE-family HTH domain